MAHQLLSLLASPGVVSVAIGANKDQTITAELNQEFQERLGAMEVMRRRSRSGLAPDLLLVDPFPIRNDQRAIINAEELPFFIAPATCCSDVYQAICQSFCQER